MRGHAGGNAQAKPNPQDASAAEPPKRNMFYDLKGMMSRRSPLIWSQV